MNKNRIVALSILMAGILFSLLPFRTSGHAAKFMRSANPIPGRYIVVLNDASLKNAVIGRTSTGKVGTRTDKSSLIDESVADASPSDTPSAAALSLSATYGGKISQVYEQALKGYSVQMSEGQALALSQDPQVKYVEEDGIMSTSTIEQNNATWGLDRADQRNLPLNGDYFFDRTGAGVNAYVIDTGIRTTHLEFGGRADMVYNAVKDGNGNTDCNGHGTHVSGTIGGSTFGVAKNVSLHGVRVLDCNGNGTTSGVISGVDWVTRHAVKPAVANMSLSGGASTSLDDAINSSIAAGITYVVAAGNANYDACFFSPARIPGAITVAASDNLDQTAWFTNWGTCVDIFAPGVNITSAWNTSDTTINTISGTSMASPHVAGTVALYLETNRKAAPAAISAALTANGTPNMLKYMDPTTPNILLYTEFVSSGACDGTLMQGTATKQGELSYQSSVDGFSGGNGLYSGIVSGPAGTQFVLALERKKGMKWTQVAGTTTPNTKVLYDGNSGVYRWRVTSLSGFGDYGVCSVVP